MALYFYFNETTGDLVYSNKSTYGASGYTSLGQQTNLDPRTMSQWVFNSKRASIVSVTKDSTVTTKIGGLVSMMSMFSNCTSLTSIDLSGLDTSQVKPMNGAFSRCTALTSLDLSGLDTSQATDMTTMFSYCPSLIDLNLNDLDTSQVTDMTSMFSGCSSLTNLNLSRFNTSQVTEMANMFYNCSSLVSLDLSSFDTSRVETMNSMFAGCSSLTSLDLSSFDTSRSGDLRFMFSNCTSLTSLDLSGFDTTRSGNFGGMFGSGPSLRLITISDKVSFILPQLPADQYYPASGGDPVAKESLTAGTWIRDEDDLTKLTTLVEQAQMSQAISRRISMMYRDLSNRLNALEKQAS